MQENVLFFCKLCIIQDREVINLLNKGYAIRDVAKLTGKAISTVQRVKKEFVA